MVFGSLLDCGANMRVLVTGCDGYIGSRLAPRLLQAGHTVQGIDTGFYRSGWLYEPRAPFPSIHTSDVRDLAPSNLMGFDAVVHLAELSNDPLGQLDPDITEKVNHRGSCQLALKARDAGVSRFIYASSCSVYGAGTGDWKDENSPPDPRTAYAQCKVDVERDVLGLMDERFAPIFLRNATVFGPSPRMRFDLVLNNLAGLAWTERAIRLTSDGSPWRPLVHVADVVEAILAMLTADRDAVAGETFNVGSTEQNYQVRDIADVVADAFPGCEFSVGPSNGDDRSYRVKFDKLAERIPTFRCQWSIERGAAELRELFARINLTTEQFQGRHHTRLLQLKHLLQTGQLRPDLYWAVDAIA